MNAYYDHRFADAPDTKHVALTPFSILVDSVHCQSFRKCLATEGVLFGHFSAAQLKTIVLSTTVAPKVVVCTTTAQWGSDAKHVKMAENGNIRFVLFEQTRRPLFESEIRQIFAITDEQANSIVEGKRSSLPEDLVEMFLPTVYASCDAFLVLCQGYLAVDSFIGTSTNHYSPSKDVRRALIDMGWAIEVQRDVSDRDDAAIPQISLSNDVARLGVAEQDKLPGIDYWLVPFDEKGTRDWRAVVSELRKKLSIEFKGTSPQPLSELLDSIEVTIDSDHDDQRSKLDPSVVARAFNCLSSKA